MANVYKISEWPDRDRRESNAAVAPGVVDAW